MFFSVRLDESGTDGRSPYAILAGAVSTIDGWGDLEAAWARMLANAKVSAFHTKEFNGRSGDFAGWSKLKQSLFKKKQEKIIRKNTLFQIAVAINIDEHNKIKKDMHGIKGFKPDSHYGMCFRVACFLACEQISDLFPNEKNQVAFLVEDGPYAADADVIYSHTKNASRAKYKPTKYGHMYGGFAHAPKETISLEAADYLAGRALAEVERGAFHSHDQQTSARMTPEFLREWYRDMLAERERKANFGRRDLKALPSGESETSPTSD